MAGRVVVTGAGGGAIDAPWSVLAGADQQDPAIFDVGGQQVVVGQQEGVVGVVDLVGARSGHAWGAVAVDDAMSGNVDHADDVVVLLGGHYHLGVG